MKAKKYIKKIIFSNKFLYRIYLQIVNRNQGTKLNIVNNGNARIVQDVVGTNNSLFIGNETTIHDSFFKIRGNNNKIIIGDNCLFGKGCSFWCEGNNLKISIGNNVTFTRNIHINVQEDENSIVVGDDCMFSSGVQIRTSDSHAIYDLNTKERINESKSVTIGTHVWIAMDAKIMKGVNISSGVIVAANSIVTKDCTKNVMVGGSPAKIIKKDCYWTREKLF